MSDKKRRMGFLVILLICFFLAGCGKPGDENKTLTPAQQEERKKNVFWQYTEPEIQLDPISEKDTPAIIYPGPGEEKK